KPIIGSQALTSEMALLRRKGAKLPGRGNEAQARSLRNKCFARFIVHPYWGFFPSLFCLRFLLSPAPAETNRRNGRRLSQKEPLGGSLRVARPFLRRHVWMACLRVGFPQNGVEPACDNAFPAIESFESAKLGWSFRD